MPLSYVTATNSNTVLGEMRKTTEQLTAVYERLSSGLRINRGSDDPAGLAVASILEAESRLSTVAIRNANDGISIAAVADAALGEVESILFRMGELAQQSSNSTYTNVQRSAFSSEFVSLGSEIERIARSTSYNGLQLLSNSSNVTIQVGTGGDATSQIVMQSVQGTLRALGLSSTLTGALTFSINDTTTAFAQTAANNALSAVQNSISSLTSLRGVVGAAESRLQVAVDYLTVMRENIDAAVSKIRDADVAADAALLARYQVLQTAQVSILAQANQEPQLLLQLLG